MNILSQLSLKWKVVAGVTAASALSVIMASAILATIEIDRLQDAIETESKTTAALVADSNLGAVAFEDTESARQSLKALNANNAVRGAVIYGSEGDPFAWYSKPNANAAGRTGTGADLASQLPGRAGRAGVLTKNNTLDVWQPMVDDGEQVGMLLLRVDLAQMQDTINAFLATAVVIVLAAVGLSVAMAFGLQHTIVAPINQLVAAMRNMAEGEGDLTQRLRQGTQ